MTDLALKTLTQRLERLERENRGPKLTGAILLLAFVAVGTMGQLPLKAVSKVVEAERFVLRDTNGKLRATLVVAADGTSGLSFFDQNGKGRLRLYVATSGPSLALADQNEKLRATLAIDADGTPGLALFDQNEGIRAVLALLSDGAPTLALADQNGKSRVGLGVSTSGPSLALLDENRKRALLGVLGPTALELFDRDGKVSSGGRRDRTHAVLLPRARRPGAGRLGLG